MRWSWIVRPPCSCPSGSLVSSAALPDRGWRGCAGQALSPGSEPVGDSSTATECSTALLFGLMIP